MKNEAIPGVTAAVLDLLRCPLDGQRLRLATADECAAAGLAGALARVDGAVFYPLVNGLPDVRPEAAVRR